MLCALRLAGCRQDRAQAMSQPLHHHLLNTLLNIGHYNTRLSMADNPLPFSLGSALVVKMLA